MDHAASNLLPVHLPDEAMTLLKVPVPIKVMGDGNCMFNAVSTVLCGKIDLHGALRQRVSKELIDSSSKYAGHPTLAAAALAIGLDEVKVFPHILSMEVSHIWDKEKDEKREDGMEWNPEATKIVCIKAEGERIGHMKKHGSFLSLLALAEVIQRPIWSLYPDDPNKFRPLYHQKITPTIVKFDIPIFILWSTLSSQSGGMLNPDHFVPVVRIL